MDMRGRIIWFDLFADDLKRAADFYNKAFGWEIHSMEGMDDMLFIALPDGEQIGAITKRVGSPVADGTSPNATLYFGVKSFADCFDVATSNGGAIFEQPMPIPGDTMGAGFAFIKDSEGNILGIVGPMDSAPEASLAGAGSAQA